MWDITLRPGTGFDVSFSTSSGAFGSVLVSGTWKSVSEAFVLVGGSWKSVTETSVLVDTTWSTVV